MAALETLGKIDEYHYVGDTQTAIAKLKKILHCLRGGCGYKEWQTYQKKLLRSNSNDKDACPPKLELLNYCKIVVFYIMTLLFL